MTENNEKKTVTLTVEEYNELIAKAGSQELAERSLADNKNEADRNLADSQNVADGNSAVSRSVMDQKPNNQRNTFQGPEDHNTVDKSTADQKKTKVKTGHLSSMINYSDRF